MKTKQTFSIDIIETLLKTVTIDADDEEQALSKAQEMYRNEQVVLGSNSYLGTELLAKGCNDN